MLVINVAPGCEYFLHKQDGVSMRCTFCAYGAPDERTVHLGQKTGRGWYTYENGKASRSRRPRSIA